MSLKEYNRKMDEAYHVKTAVCSLLDSIDSIKWLINNGYEFLDESVSVLDQQSIFLQHKLRGIHTKEQEFSGIIVDVLEVQEAEFMRMSDGSASDGRAVAEGCTEVVVAGPDVAFCPCCGSKLASCSCECFERRRGQFRKSN